MLQLTQLQKEHQKWVERNFPAETLEDAVLGMFEEVGEIAHHVLKMKQGIRGDEAMHKREILDGIADTVIFATFIASTFGLTTVSSCRIRGIQSNNGTGSTTQRQEHRMEANRSTITAVLIIAAIVFFILYAATAVVAPHVALGVGLALLAAAFLVA
jgi:NTP pyrophosphatase (non-canonical NTP hydrolase)